MFQSPLGQNANFGNPPGAELRGIQKMFRVSSDPAREDFNEEITPSHILLIQ